MKKLVMAMLLASPAAFANEVPAEPVLSQSDISRYTPFAWGECPEGYFTECTMAEVPLIWGNENSPEIEVWYPKSQLYRDSQKDKFGC